MPTSSAPVLATRVEYGSIWNSWAELAGVEPLSSETGCGQIVGSASLIYRSGVGRLPGATGAGGTIAPLVAADLVGRYVRIGIDDGLGGWSWLWYGTIDAVTTADDGGGRGQQSISCTGIAGIWAKRYLRRGWATNAIGDAVELGYLPPFNPAGIGNRTSSTYDLGLGTNSYCHQFGGGSKWTAADILTFLALSGSGLPALTIDDPLGCLGYTPSDMDFSGVTLLEALNTLANQRRGITWAITAYGASAITVTIRSTVPTAISGGSYTLAASTSTLTPDLSADPFIFGLTLTEDDSQTYDAIYVYGERPWTAMTLERDALGGGDADALVDGTSDDGFRLDLATYWTGDQWNSTADGLYNARATSGGAFTGAMSYSHVAAATEVRFTAELTPTLPLSRDWSTSVGETDAKQVPSAWLYNGTRWLALVGEAGSGWGMSLSVDAGSPGSITIGSASDADIISSALSLPSTRLVVTAGLRDPLPLLVSWVGGSFPRTTGRELVVRLPGVELWRVINGTVVGSGSGSTPDTTGGIVRDDTARLTEALALLRAYYGDTARTIQWSVRGDVVNPAVWVGWLVTSATLSGGAATVNAVISRVSHDYRQQTSTFSTERIIPDIGAIK